MWPSHRESVTPAVRVEGVLQGFGDVSSGARSGKRRLLRRFGYSSVSYNGNCAAIPEWWRSKPKPVRLPPQA
eukprot:10528516-Lingulodinium_polyedra.AAC.1